MRGKNDQHGYCIWFSFLLNNIFIFNLQLTHYIYTSASTGSRKLIVIHRASRHFCTLYRPIYPSVLTEELSLFSLCCFFLIYNCWKLFFVIIILAFVITGHIEFWTCLLVANAILQSLNYWASRQNNWIFFLSLIHKKFVSYPAVYVCLCFWQEKCLREWIASPS